MTPSKFFDDMCENNESFDGKKNDILDFRFIRKIDEKKKEVKTNFTLSLFVFLGRHLIDPIGIQKQQIKGWAS